jgi:hypothetical protein
VKREKLKLKAEPLDTITHVLDLEGSTGKLQQRLEHPLRIAAVPLGSSEELGESISEVLSCMPKVIHVLDIELLPAVQLVHTLVTPSVSV